MSTPEPVLLDTHALLWWQAESGRLSTAAEAAITGAKQVLASPTSCWQVSVLGEGGPAEVAGPTPVIAALAGQLTDLHGDPADRLIYATARAIGVPLVTKDQNLTGAAASDDQVTIIW